MSIAETILAQIGGNRFCAMTGAKNFTRLPSGLRFFLPASDFNKHRITAIEIHLNGMDYYDMKFFKSRNSSTPYSEVEDVSCDCLEEIFEKETGLLTSMTGRRVQFG